MTMTSHTPLVHAPTAGEPTPPSASTDCNGQREPQGRKIYIVTRHPGAAAWICRHLGLSNVPVISHLDTSFFRVGDKVCGVLPLEWAARICEAGAEAHVLTYDTPENLRGKELDADALERLGAQLVQYDVRWVDRVRNGDACCPPHAAAALP